MDTRLSQIKLRISRLRDALRNAGAHAILVPSADPHLSEYLPRRWQAREVFSGFTGSMGTLVVTLDDAQLFADSRYWTSAERELADSGITLFKIPTGASSQHTSPGSRTRCSAARPWSWTARCSAWRSRNNCARRSAPKAC